MPVALQAGVVVAFPLFLIAGMELAARREKTLYVTLLLGLVAVGLLLLLRRFHALSRRKPA